MAGGPHEPDSPERARPRLRVGVLFGGRSGEHDVSLQSARAVIAALQQAGHEVVPIGITRQGRWLVGGESLRTLSSGQTRGEQPVTLLPEPGQPGLMVLPVSQPGAGEPNDTAIVERPSAGSYQVSSAADTSRLDVFFPVLHGTYGEDGSVQGLFDLASVAYVGAGVLGSALGMDKVVQKTLWRGLGLPVVDFLSITRRQLDRGADAVLDRIERELGYPCFTKPANLGSSVGVSRACSRTELRLGLEQAAQYDSKLLVERGLDARELECGILGNDEPSASVVGEIVTGPTAAFYDYRAKYLDAGSQAIIPADIAPELADQVRRLAIAAFKAVDAAGLARVDFFLERATGRLYLNEINTMPGFTEISMYPKLWQASGVAFPELVARILDLGLERFAERRRNQTSFLAE